MPVFFFDYDDGAGLVRDEVGTDLPDIDAAASEASHAIAEVAADVIPGSAWRTLRMMVRDDLGQTRLQLSLVFSVETVLG